MQNENSRPPFDEEAALRELERLRGQIEEVRSRRQQKMAEFDAFVRSARAASHAERLAALDGTASPPSTPIQSAAWTADRAQLGPATPGIPPRADVRPAVDRGPFGEARRGPAVTPRTMWIGAAALVALVAIGLYGRSDGDGSGGPPSTVAQPGQQPSQPPPAAALPAPPRAVQIQLETIRPVWLQVTVDGRRQLGRTVAEGQRLTFGADQVILVRAGDAGAVRHSVAGVDRGLLGRNGQVVDRRFAR